MPQLWRSGRARGESYNWTNLGSLSPYSTPEAKDAVSGGEDRGERQSWGRGDSGLLWGTGRGRGERGDGSDAARARTEARAEAEARGREPDLEGWGAGASRWGWKVGSGEQLDLQGKPDETWPGPTNCCRPLLSTCWEPTGILSSPRGGSGAAARQLKRGLEDFLNED